MKPLLGWVEPALTGDSAIYKSITILVHVLRVYPHLQSPRDMIYERFSISKYQGDKFMFFYYVIHVRIQYPCSLGSVNSDIQSSRDVLVSFRILVCMLWSEFSNRTASFSMSAGQHWSCNMWHFRPTLSLFSLVVTLIRPWKPKVCKYGVWLEMTCKLNL